MGCWVGHPHFLLSTDFDSRAFWFKALYLGSALVAPFALVFALRYTGRGHGVTPTAGAARVEPLASWALIAANDAPGLFWSAFAPDPTGAHPPRLGGCWARRNAPEDDDGLHSAAQNA